jgi:hypothetical protein
MSACSAKADQHGTAMRSSAAQIMPQRVSNIISTMTPHVEIVVLHAFSGDQPNSDTILKALRYCCKYFYPFLIPPSVFL